MNNVLILDLMPDDSMDLLAVNLISTMGCTVERELPLNLPTFKESILYWALKEKRDFPILILNAHGDESTIDVFGRELKLKDFAKLLASNLPGGFVHLSFCSSLARFESWGKNLIKQSGLTGISGYLSDVEVVDSLAVDSGILQGAIRSNMQERDLRRRFKSVMRRASYLGSDIKLVTR